MRIPTTAYDHATHAKKEIKMTKKTFIMVFSAALIFRLSLFFVAWIGAVFLPTNTTLVFNTPLSFQQETITASPQFMHRPMTFFGQVLPEFASNFANFDGLHYTTIAEKGYVGTANIQAFFPTLPALMSLGKIIGLDVATTGMFVSNIFLIALVIIWHAFLREKYNSTTAWHGTAVLLTFPTALFLGALYTEALFLLTIIGAFWATEKRRYILALFLTIVATATKIVGIALIPSLLLQVLWQNEVGRKTLTETAQWLFTSVAKPFFRIFSREKKVFSREKLSQEHAPVQQRIKTFIAQIWSISMKEWWPLLLITLGTMGLLGYMLYLYSAFGDPLYFFHVQKEFGGIRETELVSYPRVIIRSMRVLFNTPLTSLRFPIYLQEFLAGTAGIVLSVYALSIKKISPAYVLFGLIACMLPAATGTFSSMPRYIMASLPLLLSLTHLVATRPLFRYSWYVAACAFLLINTLLFTRGFWVA